MVDALPAGTPGSWSRADSRRNDVRLDPSRRIGRKARPVEDGSEPSHEGLGAVAYGELRMASKHCRRSVGLRLRKEVRSMTFEGRSHIDQLAAPTIGATPGNEPMVIDRLMPSYNAVRTEHRIVPGSVASVYAATRRADFIR